MAFGATLMDLRASRGVSRADLAAALDVPYTTLRNYENGQREPGHLFLVRVARYFDVTVDYLLGVEHAPISAADDLYFRRYRALSPNGRAAVNVLVDQLRDYESRYEEELGEKTAPPRYIPLYRTSAAAGYASPVLDEDYDLVEVAGTVPRAATFAVRIQGDSMEPHIRDGAVAYVSRDPLSAGDVGIFCVDGEMLCKQYYKDPGGNVYLFSLNRARADADVLVTAGSGRSITCFGRVILERRFGLPGR
ncbi:MAG TPA: LexA family transcriptional regulator [Oscillospiraceae bacterium]|nr:LexA family transcriptional regulator [Oscillospiraceae bacterium]